MSERAQGTAQPGAIVTGGGTGIGAAVAQRLVRDGHSVALIGRRPDPIEAVARELRRESAGTLVCPADLGQPQDVQRAVAEAVETFGVSTYS
jgi:meso-butanediol dehydrogenase/(S,S)-butanediol dehydrogenase/diacetyl reductase